jgi:hypothetical protein
LKKKSQTFKNRHFLHLEKIIENKIFLIHWNLSTAVLNKVLKKDIFAKIDFSDKIIEFFFPKPMMNIKLSTY